MEQIAGFALAALMLCLITRERSPSMGLMVSLSAALLLAVSVLQAFSGITAAFARLMEMSGAGEYLQLTLKIIGVTYVIEFSSLCCEQAGEKLLAHQVLLAGRVILLGLTIPIIFSIASFVLERFR